VAPNRNENVNEFWSHSEVIIAIITQAVVLLIWAAILGARVKFLETRVSIRRLHRRLDAQWNTITEWREKIWDELRKK
jgi:cell division protein FtsL